MRNRATLLPAAVVMLLCMAACMQDSASAPTPKAPQTAPTPVLGMIQGTVEGEKFTATYTPASNLPPGVAGNIYGTSAVVKITGTFDSIRSTGTDKTWYFRVKLQNLLAYAIGSNYSQVAPPDTSGVFIAFYSNPVVTIAGTGCVCAVTVPNYMGTGNFTNSGERYWWYRSRPAAAPGVLGSDTTTNTPEWQFKATPNSGSDTVYGFTFSLEVSAAATPGHQNSWLTSYDGTADSLPDVSVEPPWKKFPAPATQTLGTETFVSGSSLRLYSGAATNSIYFSRNDSLGPMSGRMDISGRVTHATANDSLNGTDLQAVFGLAEPAGGKQMFVGVWGNGLSFVSFDETTGLWSQLGALCGPQISASCVTTGNSNHTYRLRKISQTSVALCVSSTQRLTLPYASLQNTTASFLNKSAVFGMPPNTTATADTARWQSTSYTMGSSGGGCPGG